MNKLNKIALDALLKNEKLRSILIQKKRVLQLQTNGLNMQKLQLTKRRNVLESTQSLEDIRDVWCADLTENLSGEVPTCEVN